MRRVLLPTLLAALLVCAGCTQSTQPTSYTTPLPTDPIRSLSALYVLRDVAQYDSVLSQGYAFKFQQADLVQGAPDSLCRADELSFAQHLFKTGTTGANAQPPAA